MDQMTFILNDKNGRRPVSFGYESLYVVGYAGRNKEKTMEHIRELERDLGVAPPKRIPTIFQCTNFLLTQNPLFHVVGPKTSGEVEYVILVQEGEIYIAVGSDHTDRDLESINVQKSKQVCPKPIGNEIWRYDEIKDHFDYITLTSYQTVEGEEILYQKGSLADILPVETILNELYERVGETGNCVIFSGTVPVRDGFRFGDHFWCEMHDPALSRSLTLEYRVKQVGEEPL